MSRHPTSVKLQLPLVKVILGNSKVSPLYICACFHMYVHTPVLTFDHLTSWLYECIYNSSCYLICLQRWWTWSFDDVTIWETFRSIKLPQCLLLNLFIFDTSDPFLPAQFYFTPVVPDCGSVIFLHFQHCCAKRNFMVLEVLDIISDSELVQVQPYLNTNGRGMAAWVFLWGSESMERFRVFFLYEGRGSDRWSAGYHYVCLWPLEALLLIWKCEPSTMQIYKSAMDESKTQSDNSLWISWSGYWS